eukprot:65361-Chlamydomonas_euryale.AAC.2
MEGFGMLEPHTSAADNLGGDDGGGGGGGGHDVGNGDDNNGGDDHGRGYAVVELSGERLSLAARHAADAARAAADELAAERRARQAAQADAASLAREFERQRAELEAQVAQ